ncbi:hypothetical protein VTI28DRAFT_2398 [Corynascus sepedonium]
MATKHSIGIAFKNQQILLGAAGYPPTRTHFSIQYNKRKGGRQARWRPDRCMSVTRSPLPTTTRHMPLPIVPFLGQRYLHRKLYADSFPSHILGGSSVRTRVQRKTVTSSGHDLDDTSAESLA